MNYCNLGMLLILRHSLGNTIKAIVFLVARGGNDIQHFVSKHAFVYV
jgi:hypothetical protein